MTTLGALERVPGHSLLFFPLMLPHAASSPSQANSARAAATSSWLGFVPTTSYAHSVFAIHEGVSVVLPG